jgi:hypothetical protein
MDRDILGPVKISSSFRLLKSVAHDGRTAKRALDEKDTFFKAYILHAMIITNDILNTKGMA